MVAALYVDARGPYARMAIFGVDAWDESRDARTYAGPYPVVAHPPCGAWGSLRHMKVPNRARRIADAECGPLAVEQVRRWGGVLEQPARSLLWKECGIPAPGDPVDEHGGYSIEIEQVRWGHPARKRTWLYLVRVPRPDPSTFPPPREPTHWVSGGRNPNRKGSGGIVPPGIKVCSAQQRRITPPALAAWLVELARQAAPRSTP